MSIEDIAASHERANSPHAAAIVTGLAQAMATLSTIIDAPAPANGTMSTAVLSAHVRDQAAAIRALARIQRRLIRYMFGAFDGAD